MSEKGTGLPEVTYKGFEILAFVLDAGIEYYDSTCQVADTGTGTEGDLNGRWPVRIISGSSDFYLHTHTVGLLPGIPGFNLT